MMKETGTILIRLSPDTAEISVEQEQNGIYNYDRTEKFDMQVIKECFSAKPEWSKY